MPTKPLQYDSMGEFQMTLKKVHYEKLFQGMIKLLKYDPKIELIIKLSQIPLEKSIPLIKLRFKC